MKSRIEKSKVSYVISVSLGTGCYRHIQISGKKTLDYFAGCIIDAFNFDFDHLYSFFMDTSGGHKLTHITARTAKNRLMPIK